MKLTTTTRMVMVMVMNDASKLFQEAVSQVGRRKSLMRSRLNPVKQLNSMGTEFTVRWVLSLLCTVLCRLCQCALQLWTSSSRQSVYRQA